MGDLVGQREHRLLQHEADRRLEDPEIGEGERATAEPAQVVALQYDRHDNLVAQGVIAAPAHIARTQPGVRGFTRRNLFRMRPMRPTSRLRLCHHWWHKYRGCTTS